MVSRKTIVLIGGNPDTFILLERELCASYSVVFFKGIQQALDFLYTNVPDLVLIEWQENDEATADVLRTFKAEPLFRQLPFLAILGEPNSVLNWDILPVEDYLRRKDLEAEVLNRVELCILRSERLLEINPLTRLPGNISINREIQSRLDRGEEFDLAYADLDHFKPFNDKYGFSRGDEVLRVMGRLILSIVQSRQPRGSYIGHIGGDDFIFIMDVGLAEAVSKAIVEAFDQIIPTFYDPDDRGRGYIESVDRQGQIRHFPLMTVSIGGVTHRRAHGLSHYGELTEAVSQMKCYAKSQSGSCFRSDQRAPVPSGSHGPLSSKISLP
ncbi:diguanylate cyclase domain-containing protein [Syntrophus buswellii]|jgi:GGDEF domain-containing protein|uniref:GGDEF domain-containing response regulator n=1 Tax=Syntrophus TaxID=43773 RepID=UPI00345E3422